MCVSENKEEEREGGKRERERGAGEGEILYCMGLAIHRNDRHVGIWAKSSSISSVFPADVNAIETLDKDFAPLSLLGVESE